MLGPPILFALVIACLLFLPVLLCSPALRQRPAILGVGSALACVLHDESRLPYAGRLTRSFFAPLARKRVLNEPSVSRHPR